MKKVLIVDDEKSFLLSLKDGLSINNDRFQVLTAENGHAAVEVLQAEPIDLLVTDLRLPKMDGFELLAWASRSQPQLPVIVMTAFSTPEIEARLAKLNTIQFLEKPLDLGVLQEGISIGLHAGPKSYIRGISLATFLQLMRLEQKSCTLKITAAGQIGYLYIKRGELLDAVYAELGGEAAALEIVSWDNAEIEMDGICRRQEPVIDSSIEHLLIEAFRIKDEKSQRSALADDPQKIDEPPETGAVEGFVAEPAATQAGPLETLAEDACKRLIGILNKHKAVQEYAVYDQKSFLVAKKPGRCCIQEFDPAIYQHLIGVLESQFSFGSFSFMAINTSSRVGYLLLSSHGYQVLAKLKPGAQPQPVAREIKRFFQH